MKKILISIFMVFACFTYAKDYEVINTVMVENTPIMMEVVKDEENYLVKIYPFDLEKTDGRVILENDNLFELSNKAFRRLIEATNLKDEKVLIIGTKMAATIANYLVATQPNTQSYVFDPTPVTIKGELNFGNIPDGVNYKMDMLVLFDNEDDVELKLDHEGKRVFDNIIATNGTLRTYVSKKEMHKK